jgi:hypothetical protein
MIDKIHVIPTPFSGSPSTFGWFGVDHSCFKVEIWGKLAELVAEPEPSLNDSPHSELLHFAKSASLPHIVYLKIKHRHDMHGLRTVFISGLVKILPVSAPPDGADYCRSDPAYGSA